MTTPEYESLLPKVEEEDLLDLVFEDVVDPSHQERWQRFSHTNPRLAKEIMKKVIVSTLVGGDDKLERQKLILDTLTFAIGALERAAKREQKESHAPEIPSARIDGDADDAGPLPSA